MRRSLLCSLIVLCSCTPAAPPAPPTPPTPPVAVNKEAPPPAPSHARWVFDADHPVVYNELDLGDGTVLQANGHGRRSRMPRDKAKAVEYAAHLLPEDVHDVRREGDKFLFVGGRGSLFVSDGPLSLATRVGKSADVSAEYAAGKRAVMGLEADGTLHRSADLGVTWSKTKLPLQPGDEVVGLAANARGEAMVLLRPQRVLFSSDDGATWSSLGTPGIGASDVTRDAAGDLWLLGAIDKQAKLLASPARLEVATGYSGRLARKTTKTKGATDDEFNLSRMVGDRVVTIRERKVGAQKEISVRVGPIDGEPGPWRELKDTATWSDVYVAGDGNTIVVAEEVEDEKYVVAVSRTQDGKTWESLGRATLKHTYGMSVFALPGWTALAAVCNKQPCEHAKFKADGKEWQDLGIAPEELVKFATYDKGTDRVLVLAEEQHHWSLYAGPRTAPLKRVELKLPKGFANAAAIDDQGALRIAFHEFLGDPIHLQKISRDLKLEPAIYPPFAAKLMHLVGSRGFAYNDGGTAWETSDGGEHWIATGAGGGHGMSCGPSGCYAYNMRRLGWDLPDPAKAVLASSTTPPAKLQAPPDAPTAKPSSVAVNCKLTGGWKSFAADGSYPERALDAGVRVAMHVEDKSGYGVIIARGAAAPQKISLLPPPSKKMEALTVREVFDGDARGIVAARYGFISGGSGPGIVKDKKYNPVDVELGWYSAATGKAQKASLPQVSPFRVGGVAALNAVVDGGLVFLPNNGSAPLYFVRDNGKVEKLTRPPEPLTVGFSAAVRVGERITVAQTTSDDIALLSTTDAGKTWTTTVWSFSASPSLTMLDDKAAVVLHDERVVVGVVPFTTPANDPPAAAWTKAPIQLLSGDKLVACGAPPARGAWMELEEHEGASSVVATITGASKEPIVATGTGGVARVRADGSACTDLVAARGEDEDSTTLYLSPADPGHAWLVRAQTPLKFGPKWAQKTQEPKLQMASATCKLQ